MKFAYMMMGDFDPAVDHTEMQQGEICVFGVPSLEVACEKARELAEQGFGCIELCGAFGEQGAKTVIQATGGRIPVGYVTHFPQQDPLFEKAFPKKA